MMRIASFLLIAVLLSTSAISGTYAKYVTADKADDTARVAKFGVEIEPNGEMFLKYYGKDDDTYSKSDDTVVTSDEWKLVAPGTKRDMTKVHLTGTPEVAVRVSYAADITLDGWTLSNGDEYCPIVFTINGKTYGTVDTAANEQSDTVEKLIARLEKVISEYYQDYAPNTVLDTIYAMDDNALEISWEWPFETGSTPDQIAANDIKDTDLGNKAAAGYHAVIKVEVTTTVTQID